MALSFPVAQLSARGPREITYGPDAEGRAAIAAHLDLVELPRLRFEGRIAPEGRGDWRLEGKLIARAVQSCVVTLAPVATRIETELLRRYLTDWRDPEDSEAEMPEDDTTEPLGHRIDVAAAVIEALDLALPAWPRAKGAALEDAPDTDEVPDPAPASPMAALAALRDRIAGGNAAEGIVAGDPDSEDGPGQPPTPSLGKG
jgi:uncharacterized metal-binding protein YceD (DUF177 family)